MRNAYLWLQEKIKAQEEPKKNPQNTNPMHNKSQENKQTFPILVEVMVQENNCPFQGDIEQKDRMAHR